MPIMLLQTAKFHSFARLSRIPPYTCAMASLFSGPLGCSHVLSFLSIAAVNIGVHVSSQISAYFLQIYTRVELLEHVVVLFVDFEEPQYCCP